MSIAEPILAGPSAEWVHRPDLRPIAGEPPALARSESRTRAFASSFAWALIGFAVVGGLWQLATVVATGTASTTATSSEGANDPLELSTAIRGAYTRVLGVEATDDDTFVSLGGDSLSYVRMWVRLEELLGPLPRRVEAGARDRGGGNQPETTPHRRSMS